MKKFLSQQVLSWELGSLSVVKIWSRSEVLISEVSGVLLFIHGSGINVDSFLHIDDIGPVGIELGLHAHSVVQHEYNINIIIMEMH